MALAESVERAQAEPATVAQPARLAAEAQQASVGRAVFPARLGRAARADWVDRVDWVDWVDRVREDPAALGASRARVEPAAHRAQVEPPAQAAQAAHRALRALRALRELAARVVAAEVNRALGCPTYGEIVLAMPEPRDRARLAQEVGRPAQRRQEAERNRIARQRSV